MISPVPLAELVAADPIALVKRAIVAELARLLPGVKVIDHPGKIDISEIVAKSVVSAPGVAVGWTRIKPVRMADAGWHAEVEWAAYVVVEDKVIADRRVERETIGFAIGARLLAILGDPDEQLWGLGFVTPPEAPGFKPFFTVRDAAQGVAYYAATWSQTITNLGGGLWGDTPAPMLTEGELEFETPAALDQALRDLGFGLPEPPDWPAGSSGSGDAP